MASSSALGVGRVFAKFFPLFSWVSNEPGSKHWLWLHNYGHPHFYDLFLTLPQAGSRAQAQTTESKHSLSEVRDTRQVFINLLVTNHKDTISSCPRIDYFMKEIFFCAGHLPSSRGRYCKRVWLQKDYFKNFIVCLPLPCTSTNQRIYIPRQNIHSCSLDMTGTGSLRGRADGRGSRQVTNTKYKIYILQDDQKSKG